MFFQPLNREPLNLSSYIIFILSRSPRCFSVVEMIFIYSKNLNHGAHREHGEEPAPEAGARIFKNS
jgi:hypothetical protein